MNDRTARSHRNRSQTLTSLATNSFVLESRQLMTAAPAQVVMLSATTVDSESVTVDYQINNEALTQPLTLGVYRSATSTYDSNAIAAGTVTIPATSFDTAGNHALSLGTHEITLPLDGGLPPNPEHPYVLVVANPGTDAVNAPTDTASFRKTTIGVIIHGGVQPQGWKKNGPPWEQTMAKSLRAEGYDLVIAYNWVAESGHAGAARKQVPRVAHLIEEAAQQIDPNSPVDLHVIGHSEGAVIAGLSLAKLEQTPNLLHGYKELTLLDPHSASNGFKGKQFSVSNNLMGSIARAEITRYQSQANDPPAMVPSDVNDAQVFFQHTPISAAHGSNNGLYNLWGQVPVIAAPNVPVHYANLTGSGISHAGDVGVYNWYQTNIVPKLGNGPALFNPSALTANLTLSATQSPMFAGTGVPGAAIDVYARAEGKSAKLPLGTTTVDSTGHWTIPASRSLPVGAMFFAHAKVPVFPGLKRVYVSPTVQATTSITP